MTQSINARHVLRVLWTLVFLVSPCCSFVITFRSTQQQLKTTKTTKTPLGTSHAVKQPSQVAQHALYASTSNDVDTDQSAATTTATKSSPRSGSARDKKYDIILYDGVCNFCNTWVDILLRLDVSQKFRFAPLQSQVGQELLVSIGKKADDISSVVLIKAQTGEAFDKSRCVLKVVEELGPLAAVASRAVLAIVPEPIRDSIYDTVAENRYNLMGKRDECRCSDPEFADRFLLD